MPDRLVLAITGASGVIYGIRALEIARGLGVETHLILSPAAETIIAHETQLTADAVRALASVSYTPDALHAPIASGSFPTRGMLIAPCSIKTLSAVANSYAANLTTRAADVCLKEGRPLVLMVREAPLHPGHLRLMLAAARAGAIIFPPVPAFYSRPATLEEVITATAGRALARLGFDNACYHRWEGTTPAGSSR